MCELFAGVQNMYYSKYMNRNLGGSCQISTTGRKTMTKEKRGYEEIPEISVRIIIKGKGYVN
jgi:hypothetical protein